MAHMTTTCKTCNRPFRQERRSGRPRQYCYECRPLRANQSAYDAARYTPRPAREHVCQRCGETFRRQGAPKFCSKDCRYAASMIPCAACGEPTGTAKRDRRVHTDGPVYHPSCTPIVHGTSHAYRRRGCRCDECRAWNAAAAKATRERFREQHGYSLRHRYAPAPGHGQQWIDRPSRLALYERDRWTCQGCGLLTSEDAERIGDRPSLDHIIPRSKGGTHDPDNLQLLCRSCNSRKKDRLPEADQED